jgi:hypothetical protein
MDPVVIVLWSAFAEQALDSLLASSQGYVRDISGIRIIVGSLIHQGAGETTASFSTATAEPVSVSNGSTEQTVSWTAA